ncbi:hypothetical protein IQ243_01810 [Nostocales cyanobacterium LEGE 11386]|nr:hypothetical protein [Nostocales cyanobacterium LEGE 11386]
MGLNYTRIFLCDRHNNPTQGSEVMVLVKLLVVYDLVQICVKSWRIEGGNLNAKLYLAAVEYCFAIISSTLGVMFTEFASDFGFGYG